MPRPGHSMLCPCTSYCTPLKIDRFSSSCGGTASHDELSPFLAGNGRYPLSWWQPKEALRVESQDESDRLRRDFGDGLEHEHVLAGKWWNLSVASFAPAQNWTTLAAKVENKIAQPVLIECGSAPETSHILVLRREFSDNTNTFTPPQTDRGG